MKGYISLQNHGTKVWYRSIKLKDLSKPDNNDIKWQIQIIHDVAFLKKTGFVTAGLTILPNHCCKWLRAQSSK